MAENRGKQFEQKIKESFLKIPDVSVDRLHDQTAGHKGGTNICDFIVYKEPFQYYIECKSVHGNTFSIHGTKEENKYGYITNTQWEGLMDKSTIQGVHAGVIIWFIDHDVTLYFPIQVLNFLRNLGQKSVRYDENAVVGIGKYIQDGDQSHFTDTYYSIYKLVGIKKRVFFNYDMSKFFREVI